MAAWTYHRAFGQLPYPGGTFQQPARLLREMLLIEGEMRRYEVEQAEQAPKRR